MSEKGLRIEVPVHIKRDRRARKAMTTARVSQALKPAARMKRLLALSWKWELAVRRGEVSYTELAKRHGLSRARVTQICNLTLLPSDVQERMLTKPLCLPALADASQQIKAPPG